MIQRTNAFLTWRAKQSIKNGWCIAQMILSLEISIKYCKALHNHKLCCQLRGLEQTDERIRMLWVNLNGEKMNDFFGAEMPDILENWIISW